MRRPDQSAEAAGSWSSWTATAILAACAVVLGSVFAYASVHHEHYSSAPRTMRLCLYVIAPLTALSLVAGIRWLSPRARMRLTLLLMSLLIAFYATEGALALLQSVDNRQESAAVAGDGRSKRHVVTDLRAKGIRAVPDLRPEVFLRAGPDGTVRSALQSAGREVLPLGGIPRTTTVLCNETGEWVVYVSDERGFNNPQGVWAAQPLEVAIVGDSFAHGYCRPTHEHLVDVVRKRIPSTLNLGMAGNGPLLMLASIVEYLSSLKPRHVVWLYCEGNDMSNLETEKRSQLLMRYLDPDFSQGLAERQDSIEAMLTDWIDRRLATVDGDQRLVNAGRSNLANVLKLSSSRRLLNLSYEYQLWGDFALFQKVLTRARDQVAVWGGTLHFVYLPSRRQEDLFSDAPAVQREIMAIASSLNLPVIDIRRVFAEYQAAQPTTTGRIISQGRSLGNLVERGGHYSAAGNRLVGEAMVGALASPPR